MNPEHVLVPFQAAELPAGPWLVFAPHADDETFGMGGSLLRAKEASLQTHVIVMTDGALGGDGEDLVEVRRREVEEAVRSLGVTTLQLWEEPDRGLGIATRLVGKAIAAIRHLAPASVFFPAALELHPDHRAAAQLVWGALQELAREGDCPAAYGYEISVQSPINLLLDITAQVPAKREIMESYASQVGQVDYPALVSALNCARALTLPAGTTSAEGYFRYQKADLELDLAEVTARFIRLYFG